MQAIDKYQDMLSIGFCSFLLFVSAGLCLLWLSEDNGKCRPSAWVHAEGYNFDLKIVYVA